MADPRRVVLFGMYGAINVGDELICRSVVQGLKKRFPDVVPVVVTSNKKKSLSFNPIEGAEYVEGGRFHYSFWFNLLGYLRALRQADAIVIGGGGLIQDHYSWRLSMSTAFCALTGKLLGKPVYVIGVGAGPLNRPEIRNAVRAALNSVDLVCVRDARSKDALVDCKVAEENIDVTADVVPSMSVSIPAISRPNNSKRIAFILREWPGIDKRNLASLLERLVGRGFEVSMLCFEPTGDAAFYSEVIGYCDPITLGSVSIVKPDTVEDAIRLVAEAGLVVSMRYHGCILAMMLGKPLIPVEYEYKVRSLALGLGLDDLLIQTPGLNADLFCGIETHAVDWSRRGASVRDNWKRTVVESESNFKMILSRWQEQSGRSDSSDNALKNLGHWQRIVNYAIKGEMRHSVSRLARLAFGP